MNKWFSMLVLGLAVSTWGCSGDPALQDGAARTTVTVSLDGAPVEGAAVVFSPMDSGRSATGLTDADGIAEMGTSATGDGVFPGQYQISVIKKEVDPATVIEDPKAYYERTGQPPPTQKMEFIVPQKYSIPKTSGLETTVRQDERNEVRIELES